MSFYYFPKTNVYYDISHTSYIYSIDSGKHWTVLVDSSRKNTDALGKRIELTNSTSDIWKDNEIHRKMYGGTLINLVRQDSLRSTSTAKSKNLLKKKKVISTADSLKMITEVPHKKRTFFQRLFGKKKKKIEPIPQST